MAASPRFSWVAGLAGRVGWRRVAGSVRLWLRAAVTGFVVFTVTLWLMPGVRAVDVRDTLWLVVLVAAVGAVLRPLLLLGVWALGGLAALGLGAAAQVIVVAVALSVDPADQVSGVPATAGAAVVAVVVAAAVNWLVDAGTDELFVGELRRLMIRTRRGRAGRARARRWAADARGSGRVPGRRLPGLLVVQLDGVSAPVLSWAVRAGNLPTIGGWLRRGSHQVVGWHTGLPATTPAAQAGILHGVDTVVPGYRWYDRDRRRVMVASRTRDAAEVQRRLSTGGGLLRDGGASVSNAFTGDAPTSLLTVGRSGWPGRSARGWAVFMASPFGLTRALVLGVAEMVTELHQARVQRRRNVQPRVNRLGPFVALRPAAMLLRDVTVSLVAEQMARGAAVIFCDLVDYDEVAHHAGPARPEALAALEKLDHTLSILQRLTAEAARDYHMVVLSDHGQSFGAPFRHQYGQTLHQVVAGLAAHSTEPDPAAGPQPTSAGAPLVLASGNLAMIYFPGRAERLTRAGVDRVCPGLIDGLLAHPGVGVVVVVDEDGPVALGRRGRHRLRDGTVEGQDPLAGYGPRARADLLRHQRIEHVGDLVVLSAVDSVTGEIAAFEELVGSHGGLGGWQTEAVLVHPTNWPRIPADLDGPLAVHRQLLAWLRMLGLRQQPGHPPASRPCPEATPVVPTTAP